MIDKSEPQHRITTQKKRRASRPQVLASNHDERVGNKTRSEQAARRGPQVDPDWKPPASRNHGVPEVVPCYQLAKVMREWSKAFIAERPPYHKPTGEAHPDKSVLFIGPLDYIEEHTGIPRRRLQAIVNEEQGVVNLTRAEAILMAIGKEHLLATGEIQVVMSPFWSLERYVEYMRERGCM